MTETPPLSLDSESIEVVRTAKDRMVGLCLEQIEESGLPPIKFFERVSERVHEDELSILGAYLRLETFVLDKLSADHVSALEGIAADAEAQLASLLRHDARTVLQERGIRPFLALVDYPAMAEFFHRWNRLPAPGRNEGDYRGLYCPKPFEYAEIATSGRTFLCCPLQVPTVVGEANDGTFMEVWNSEKAQAIRKSILDGSFSHCIEKTCGVLQSRSLQRREDVTDPYHRDIIDNDKTVLDRGPATIFMNYDRSCNLACPSCRTKLIVLRGKKEKRAAAEVQDWATGEHLADAKYLHITGTGDAFGSNLFHGFLRRFDSQKYPELRISIGTNGLLLTEKTWEKVCKDSIEIVVVSVDAATAETYAKNRGGDFDILLENLEFIGTQRTSGQLKAYGLNFVVQQNNYLEMPTFVELAERVHADGVCFQQLTNWGTFTSDEFKRRAVHRASHPKHSDLLRVLAEPMFGRPIVDLYNLSSLRPLRPVPAAE